MAAVKAKSFVQYSYCEFCQRNHQQGPKHVYSKRHKTILSNILKKFEKKVIQAQADAESPVIHSHGWETGAAIWCYFCARDVKKHQELNMLVVRNGGFMEHLASAGHLEKAHTFWLKHKLDRSLKTQYLMSDDQLNRFKAKAVLETERQLQHKHKQVEQVASHIRRQSQKQHNITHFHRQLQETTSKSGSNSRKPTWKPHERSSQRLVQTITGTGEGFTAVRIQDNDNDEDDEGNVHTGATPPWLKDDDDEEETKSGDIGPSLSLYQKQVELNRKRKLPPDRVGAKFDHKGVTGAGWLPSFGSVWSKQRRKHTREQFMRKGYMKTQFEYSDHEMQHGSAKPGRMGNNDVKVIRTGGRDANSSLGGQEHEVVSNVQLRYTGNNHQGAPNVQPSYTGHNQQGTQAGLWESSKIPKTVPNNGNIQQVSHDAGLTVSSSANQATDTVSSCTVSGYYVSEASGVSSGHNNVLADNISQILNKNSRTNTLYNKRMVKPCTSTQTISNVTQPFRVFHSMTDRQERGETNYNKTSDNWSVVENNSGVTCKTKGVGGANFTLPGDWQAGHSDTLLEGSTHSSQGSFEYKRKRSYGSLVASDRIRISASLLNPDQKK